MYGFYNSLKIAQTASGKKSVGNCCSACSDAFSYFSRMSLDSVIISKQYTLHNILTNPFFAGSSKRGAVRCIWLGRLADHSSDNIRIE